MPEHERPSSDVTRLGLGPRTSREGVFYEAKMKAVITK